MTARRKSPMPTPPSLRGHALGLLFFAVEVGLAAHAADPFRSLKNELAVAGLAVLVTLWALARLREDTLELPRGPLALALAAYPALLAVSALWAASPFRALEAAATAAVWVAAALALAGWEPAERRTALAWTTAGVMVSAGVMGLQLAGVPVLDVGLLGRSQRYALTGLSGNPADLAMASVLILPLLLARRLEKGGSASGWIVPLVLATTAVLTRTLTAMVAVIALLAVVLALLRSRRAWLAATASVALVAAIAVAGGLLPRLEYVVTLARAGDWYQVLSARADGWTAASQMIREHPLTGVGGANYTQRFYPARLAWLEAHGTTGRRGERATHFQWAHCDPLQVVAELGLVGLIWLAGLAAALVAGARRRSGPLVALAAAAWLPLLVLHFPTHLAVGLVPAVLTLAPLLADEPRLRAAPSGAAARVGVALVLVAMAAAVVLWQGHRLAVQLWRGDAETILRVADGISAARRSAVLRQLEREAYQRVAWWPEAAPWLWRIVGRAALGQGRIAAAAEAFRTAQTLWPHEEAEFGLGLALAAQGRPSEALVRLARVSRVNPALTALIPDQSLRRAVEDLTAKWGANKGWLPSPPPGSARGPGPGGSTGATPAAPPSPTPRPSPAD